MERDTLNEELSKIIEAFEEDKIERPSSGKYYDWEAGWNSGIGSCIDFIKAWVIVGTPYKDIVPHKEEDVK